MNIRSAARGAIVAFCCAALAGIALPAVAHDYAKWGPIVKASGFKP